MNETVKQAYNRLLTEYTDINGRTCLYHKSLSDPATEKWDSENQHLWQGQGDIMAALHGLDQRPALSNFKKALRITKVDTGLYSRQPNSHLGDNTISHDEYNGILYSCAAFDNFPLTYDIYEYGNKYQWCYLDTHPHVKPFSKFWRNPKHWWELVKVLKSKDMKKERSKYPVIYQMSHRRGVEDTVFTTIMADKEPSWFKLFCFAVSIIYSATKPHGNTGGKIISFYKLQSIKLNGFEHPLIDWAIKSFNKRMTKMYGTPFYMEKVKAIYYRDANHPFHTLIKGLTL